MISNCYDLDVYFAEENEAPGLMDSLYEDLNKATTTRERRKMYDFMVIVFNRFESLHNLWEHLADNFKLVTRFVRKVVEKVATYRKSKYDEIINDNGYDIRKKDGEQCYLFRFFNDDEELLCSKVGTTTRTVRQRLIEELRSKTYKGMGATHAIIDRIYNCGELPAEGLESLIRSEYIKKYPKSFKKNDRFIGELFDLDLCDSIAHEYLEMA